MTLPANTAASPSGSPAPASNNNPDDADPLKPGAPVSGATARVSAATASAATASAGARGLRVAVLHNSKLETSPATHSGPKDVLAELDNPVNVRNYMTAISALGHSVVAFDGGPDLPALLSPLCTKAITRLILFSGLMKINVTVQMTF